MRAIVYDESGAIIEEVTAYDLDQLEKQVGAGSALYDVGAVSYKTHYVDIADDLAIKERAPLDINSQLDSLTVSITGVPSGSRVEVGIDSLEADGGVTEIEFDIPGTYKISIFPPAQFLDTELEVTVG